MAVRSPYPDVQIPEVSLHQLILEKSLEYGDRPALIDDATGRTLTFNDFVDDVRAVHRSLKALGMEKDDVVAMFLPNVIEYPVLMYGTLCAGGIVAGVITAWSQKEIYDVLEISSPRFMFTLPHLVDVAKAVCSALPHKPEIFTLNGRVDGFRTYEDFVQLGSSGDIDLAEVKVDAKQQVAIHTYSTGTTGRRKCVMVTHYNFVANISQISQPELDVYTGHDVVIATRPVTHGYGLVIHFTAGIYTGATHVFLDNPRDTAAVLKAIPKYKVTMLPFTPLNLVQLIRNPEVDDYDFSTLHNVFCAGAPLNPAIREKFVGLVKSASVRDMFGMSEVLIAFIPRDGGSGQGIGVPLPNVQAKIIDASTGETLGTNTRGELVLRSPSVCLGYKDMVEAQAEVFLADGWFRTGDIAYYDDNLNFFIVDRIKELISYDAYKVSPVEVEGVILGLPGVAEVGVVGMPDDVYVELTRAFVVKQPGSDITEEDVKKIVENSLNKSKWLHGGVEFVDSLPKSPTGKVMRRLVKESMLSKMAATQKQ